MKIDINDPRITAFALGELTGSEAIEIARAVRSDLRVRAAVEETRETAALLHGSVGGGQVGLLTTEQREAVHSAGGEGPLTQLTSAEVSFWRRPVIVAIGAAAIVTLGVFITQKNGRDTREVVDIEPGWDWSAVAMENLTSPVVVDYTGDKPPHAQTEASATAVAAAIREDTVSFREELHKRISEQDAEALQKLPELKEQDWHEAQGNSGLTLPVPQASGATSWPLLQRYITENSALPPISAVRIEEMVNHFHYKTPSMLRGAGLVADIELCNTPWNPATMLLAVHISSDVKLTAEAAATVSFNIQQVSRARLLGYSSLKSSATNSSIRGMSRSHGNYVIYELELSGDSDLSIATLQLGDEVAASLTVYPDQAKSWFTSSADLRFASTVTATGMLLTTTTSAGELDASRLLSLLGLLEEKDKSTLSGERRHALTLLTRAAELVDVSTRSGD